MEEQTEVKKLVFLKSLWGIRCAKQLAHSFPGVALIVATLLTVKAATLVEAGVAAAVAVCHVLLGQSYIWVDLVTSFSVGSGSGRSSCGGVFGGRLQNCHQDLHHQESKQKRREFRHAMVVKKG